MTVYLQDTDLTLHHGDCLEVLRTLPDRSVHMCATSPPFYGLRDYGTGEWVDGDPACDHTRHVDYGTKSDTNKGAVRGGPMGQTCDKCGARRVDQQIGLEETPDQWVERLVAVFREVRRVLRDDGTLWVEIGDSYAHPAMGGTAGSSPDGPRGGRLTEQGRSPSTMGPGLKQKDLLGQPWLLAFALRADGWFLRSEIIWARPNPMPESVTDRPTKSHSTVFLLSKAARYFYDADAIREPHQPATRGHDPHGARGDHYKIANDGHTNGEGSHPTAHDGHLGFHPSGANARSVWQIPTEPTPFAHFATWPRKLVARMILAGCPEGGTVLDPFAGSGTTLLVARQHGRHSIGIELNPAYCELVRDRTSQQSLLADAQ